MARLHGIVRVQPINLLKNTVRGGRGPADGIVKVDYPYRAQFAGDPGADPGQYVPYRPDIGDRYVGGSNFEFHPVLTTKPQ